MATMLDPKAAPPSEAPSFRSGSPTPEDLTTLGHSHILRRLPQADLAIVIHSIGGSRNAESQVAVHPTSWLYPPKGLPTGLYRDVVVARTGAMQMYYTFSIFFNSSLVLQLVLGALLTALGSRATGKDVLITILAAGNTVIAGLLALMHNSGLPDRYQKDWEEYDKVEMYMRELMETGITLRDMTRDECIEVCYANFRKAKDTIARNSPSAYSPTEGGAQPVGQSGPPRLH